jgi:hypothetical protein
VLRFWNNDVLKNIEGVKAVIHDELARLRKGAPPPPPPPPPPRGGGGGGAH